MLKMKNLNLIFICLLITGCSDSEPNKKEIIRPAKVFHITGSQDAIERSFPGRVEASEKADLAFRIPGKIIEFPVKEGDKVEKDAIIAKLDPKDYEIALEDAKSKYEYAKTQLDRMTKLVEQQFISKSKYDAQKTAADGAKADLDQAQKNLEYTSLTAPFAGEIAKKYVDNFQTVKEKDQIVRLHNREMIDITIQIPESIAIRSDGANKAQFKVEFDSASGKLYEAKIKEISSQPDPDTQTYAVTIILLKPQDLSALPGMTTTVHVTLKLDKNAQKGTYLIPASAVFADAQNNSYVWLVQAPQNTIKKQAVKLGQLQGNKVVIIGGISPGQTIVEAGVKFLHEGMKIRPLNMPKEK